MPTLEEIKNLTSKLASEYVAKHQITATQAYYENKRILEVEDVLPILQWLSNDYCIVPKSKVIGLWNEINDDAKTNIANGFPDYAEFNKLQLTPLEILFGKSLFEKDKR